MTQFLFPDNTVLCNYAAVDQLDLLRSTLNERGRWTAAMAYEAQQSARVFPSLTKIVTEGWMGAPIEIADATEIQQINRIRRGIFGGTDDEPLRHLGEAETCYVLCEWEGFARSWWISDDRETLRYARFRGITTRETVDLMSMAVVNGDIGAQEAFELMAWMADQGRNLRLPFSHADLVR